MLLRSVDFYIVQCEIDLSMFYTDLNLSFSVHGTSKNACEGI